jgi:hypothetical protein
LHEHSINESQTAERQPECDGKEHPATGGGHCTSSSTIAEDAPRLVIRGESFTSNPYPGERSELVAFGSKGQFKEVLLTLPKLDAEPLAALTDYLNFTFPLKPGPESIVSLVRELKTYLGPEFGTIQDKGRGLYKRDSGSGLKIKH